MERGSVTEGGRVRGTERKSEKGKKKDRKSRRRRRRRRREKEREGKKGGDKKRKGCCARDQVVKRTIQSNIMYLFIA